MATQFTRLALENWRNFRKVDIPLGERVFVVGPNAAGKTNLLDAIRFLRDIAIPGGSLAAAVQSRGGISHVRSLHAGGKKAAVVSVEVEARVGDDDTSWRYQLVLEGSTTQKKPVSVVRECVWHGDRLILERPTEHDRADPLLLSQTHLEQISTNRDFRPLVDALANVADVHVVPQIARAGTKPDEPLRRDAAGSDFIERLAKQTDAQKKRRLARISKLLKVAVPKFEELQVVRDDVGRPHLNARYAHWRRVGALQDEQEFSDGTLRLIGLLYALDDGKGPLLLEEPELSLHAKVVRQLPRLIARAASRTGRQVIVTTHAEEMLDDAGVDPSEIVLLLPSDHETTATVASRRAEFLDAVEAGLPLGELVTSVTKPKDIEQLALGFDR